MFLTLKQENEDDLWLLEVYLHELTWSYVRRMSQYGQNSKTINYQMRIQFFTEIIKCTEVLTPASAKTAIFVEHEHHCQLLPLTE